MDIMLRILKYPASGGSIGDVADVYEVEDLTNYKINNTDCILIVNDAPFDTLKEAKEYYCTDVSIVDPMFTEPEIKVLRRNRFSIDWAFLAKSKAEIRSKGWAVINNSILQANRVDHK